MRRQTNATVKRPREIWRRGVHYLNKRTAGSVGQRVTTAWNEEIQHGYFDI